MLNKPAPEFSLPDFDGNMHSLKDYRGKWIILYFYPKDNTPGCTQEALEFTEAKGFFDEHNAIVIGISKDDAKSHEKFMIKHNLEVLLLTDADNEVQKLYDVYQLKKFMRTQYMGTDRSTFLINPQGILVQEWRNVRVKNHVSSVCSFLKESL